MNGWRIDLENFDNLFGMSGEDEVLELRGLYKEVAFDPKKLIRTENQKKSRRCQATASRLAASGYTF